mmetsp:Transcript_45871/g.147304  ORF Transcript_45871/g.147304 Transcript_45871/m.147304 type:complete len:217 (+) Transcript_45871:56-706(+)
MLPALSAGKQRSSSTTSMFSPCSSRQPTHLQVARPGTKSMNLLHALVHVVFRAQQAVEPCHSPSSRNPAKVAEHAPQRVHGPVVLSGNEGIEVLGRHSIDHPVAPKGHERSEPCQHGNCRNLHQEPTDTAKDRHKQPRDVLWHGVDREEVDDAAANGVPDEHADVDDCKVEVFVHQGRPCGSRIEQGHFVAVVDIIPARGVFHHEATHDFGDHEGN